MRRAVIASIAVLSLPAGARGQGNLVGPEFLVNTYTTGLQAGRSVARDSRGSFVVVWTSKDQDGSDYGVFGQRFAVIVPAELIHFGVE